MKDVKILTDNGINVQQSIELLGDIEMYNETLEDFLSMVAEKLNHLEAYKTNDMPNYAIDVHSLKSDSRYLGFTTLADLSYESEMKSKAGDVNFVNENHPKIINEAKRIIALAQQYLGHQVVDLVPNIGASTGAPATPAQNNIVNPAPAQNNVVPTAPDTPEVQVTAQPVTQNVAQPVAQTVAPATNVATPQTTGLNAANNVVANNDIMNNALLMNETNNAEVPAVKKGIILVIDDSNLVANFVRKIFNENYDVMIANDGQSGVNLISDPEIREKIKACLLDLNMPNMNGFGVMDFLNKNGYFVKIPVAIISGIDDAESIEKANSYPIIDILHKPFNERDIQNVVEKCLAAYF